MEHRGHPARARIAFAAAAALLVAGIALALTLTHGDGDERPATAADPRCLRSWNSDPAAADFGRHNYKVHRYDRAWVTSLDLSAQEAAPGRGRCAVVFPARALDPEPFAAGQILVGSGWLPLSSLFEVSLTTVAELQARATAEINASLDAEGRLAALDDGG